MEKFLSAEALSERKTELLKPRNSYPAILWSLLKRKSYFSARLVLGWMSCSVRAQDMMAPPLSIGL